MRLTCLIFCFAFFSFLVSAQTIVFKNVNVIAMDKERILQNQNVLVKDGIISEIGKKVKIPKDSRIIEGRGKFLIPGLMDMHTHLLSDGDDFPDSIAEDELKVMLANGVTTIRLMIGTPEQSILRAKPVNGEIIAPTIYAASPHLRRDYSPDAARSDLRTQRIFSRLYDRYDVFSRQEIALAVQVN